MKWSGRRGVAAVLALSLGAGAVSAQEEASAGPQITHSGFVDVYYQWNSARIAPNRIFDLSHNTFRTALVKYSVAASQDKAGGQVDLIYGQTADVLGGIGTAISFEQAFATYQPHEKVKLTFGKFVTHIGFEVIESVNNLNYSRGYIFGWTIPFDHTGFKADVTFNDQYSAMVGLYNTGWNDEVSANSDKTLALQFIGQPHEKVGFVLNGIHGDESSPTADQFKRTLLNGILNLNPTEKIYLGLDLTYGQQEGPASGSDTDVMPYTGLAGYASYKASEKWSVAGRVERLNDRENVTGIGVPKVQDATLTLAYTEGALTKKLEFRYDEALNAEGNKMTGFFPDPDATTQRTITASWVYSF